MKFIKRKTIKKGDIAGYIQCPCVQIEYVQCKFLWFYWIESIKINFKPDWVRGLRHKLEEDKVNEDKFKAWYKSYK